MDEICRLCLADTNRNYDEYTSYFEKIQLLMPEIDLNITPTLILCDNCSNNLNSAYTFKEKCLQNEERIKNYLSETQTPLTNLRWFKDQNYNDTNKLLEEVKVKVEYDNDFNEDRFTNSTKLDNFKDINSIEEEYNLTFPKVEIFRQEEIVENESLKAFVCEICMESFKNPIELDRHHIVHSKINRLQDDYSKEDPLIFPNREIFKCHIAEYATNQCIKEESELFMCEICKESFKESIELNQHHRRTHLKSDSYKTVYSNGSIRYFCDICNKSFKRKQNLEYHKNTHNDKMYTCWICSKSYRHLENHIKNVHVKTHVCKFCDKTFGMKSQLLDHIRTHTGDRPYLCEVCGKGFPRKGTLRVHMHSHRTEKRYLCNICQRGYTSKISLERHMVVHVPNPEKPFVCEIITCSRRFESESSLRNHMGRHRRGKTHRCYLCDKSFFDASTLKIHMKSHTGERPYECGTCHRRFALNMNFERHLKIHIPKKI